MNVFQQPAKVSQSCNLSEDNSHRCRIHQTVHSSLAVEVDVFQHFSSSSFDSLRVLLTECAVLYLLMMFLYKVNIYS
jgi:hypothetical protein